MIWTPRLAFLVFSIVLVFSCAQALTISPSSASVDNINNVLTVSAINNTAKDVQVSFDASGFAGGAIASSDSEVIPANSTAEFMVAFYDGIYKTANVCIAESGKGTEKMGAAIRVCASVKVNTTESGLPAKESVNGTKGSVFFNSQLRMASAVFEGLSHRVSSLKEMQLLAEYSKAKPEISGLRTRLLSINDNIGSENYQLAEALLEEFFAKARETGNGLPAVSVLGQKTTEYFSIVEGQRIMDDAHAGQIESVLGMAGLTDRKKIATVLELRNRVSVTRNFESIYVRDIAGGKSYYQTNVKIFLQNNAGSQLKNIVLLEYIPEQLVPSLSNTTSDYGFNLISESPAVFELYAGDLEPDVVKEISYKISNRVSVEKAGLFMVPVVLNYGVRQLQLSQSEEIVREFRNLVEKKDLELEAQAARLEAEKSARASYWPYLVAVLVVILLIALGATYREVGKVHAQMRRLEGPHHKR
ncbi:MAG: hypothetical protein HY394_02810 [Candidatus Diapherotrites archaeon]|nr:hypothetical protein [Candidatus Diapherotrites archaeon]